nr:hypothetical protein [Methanohalobium sp.]
MTDDVVSVETDLDKVVSYKPMIDGFHGLIVTWNGENYRGGFDFPWLRSKCIQKDIDWQLDGVKHLDLLPLVRKYINTTHYVTETPSKSQFKAADLRELAEVNGIDYQNMKQAYNAICELDNPDWLDYDNPEAKEDNSLQEVYQMLFDPECEEIYTDGGEIPKLYNAIEDNENKKAIVGEHEEIERANSVMWDRIKSHNRRDVKRLKKVAEAVVPLIPDWELKRNINKL